MDKFVEGRDRKWQPDWATHPGEHLAEYIETNNWSQAEFARLAGMTKKHVSTIISGDNPVTAETALKLERVLGVKASFWTNLQSNWDIFKAKASEKIEAKDAKTWLQSFPLKELAERGFCRHRDDLTSCMNDILTLLGIGSPHSVDAKIQSLAVQHRQARKADVSYHHVLVWLMLGERRAQLLELPPFNAEVFQKSLIVIRQLTLLEPNVFEPIMIEECGKSGVALIFEKPISKTCLYGSARWVTNEKAIIQMSLRMKYNDHFWWTFFHEAGHILLHAGINFADDKGGEGDGLEDEADAFAMRSLVNRKNFESFVASKPKSKSEVSAFSKEEGIHPGIVVGMLQYRRVIPFGHMNELKEKFAWADEVEQ